MKTVRVDCGPYETLNMDIELCSEMFGKSGTQADRRWFFRIHGECFGEDWRRKGRRVRPNLVIYFRDAKDATWFMMKRG